MRKPSDPKDLVLDLIPRSVCSVQMAAVICDAAGAILGWGWNHSGPDGYGMCAERYALMRCNQSRLWSGTIYVAGKWAEKGTLVHAKPCEKCEAVIRKFEMEVVFRNKKGKWI